MKKETKSEEILAFLKEHVVVKSELAALATRKDLNIVVEKLEETESRLSEKIDSKFSGTQRALDAHTHKHPADHLSHESRILYLERLNGVEPIIDA